MYVIVRVIGIYMGSGILTNICQGAVGVITYVLGSEILFRAFKKESIIIYVRNMIKDK